MTTYRQLPKTGTHRQDGHDYNGGDTVESELDLAAVFPLKFERVLVEPQQGHADATDKFAAATDNGLTVQQRGGWFYVCGADGPEISGALRREAVEDFIWDYVEESAS